MQVAPLKQQRLCVSTHSMEQAALDFSPLCRRSDPVTSYRAAERATVFKARDISIIWAALKDHGRMTPREIAEVSGLDYVAVQRRGAEMERKKLIVRGPEIKDGMRVWDVAGGSND